MTGQRVTSDLAVLAGGCEWEGSDSEGRFLLTKREVRAGMHLLFVECVSYWM